MYLRQQIDFTGDRAYGAIVTPIDPPIGKLVSALPLQEGLASRLDSGSGASMNFDAMFIANYQTEIGKIEEKWLEMSAELEEAEKA